jgi:repressor LexA
MGRKPQVTKEQVLTAIQKWVIEHRVPPTVAELRKQLKAGSDRTVLRYLEALEEDESIERWGGARGIRLLKRLSQGLATKPVPIVGTAPAGPLMLAEENFEGWLQLPTEDLRPKSGEFFLLRVRGDSMNRAQVDGGRIESGDLVLVRRHAAAESGDVVVTLIDGEATIKRFMRGPNYYFLKPESSKSEFQPIIVDDRFSVQGVVVRVFKNGVELLISENSN